MGNAIADQLRLAAEGLMLTDAQKHVLAYRLTRKLKKMNLQTVNVTQMLEMIDTAMRDMTNGVDMLVVSEESYY